MGHYCNAAKSRKNEKGHCCNATKDQKIGMVLIAVSSIFQSGNRE